MNKNLKQCQTCGRKHFEAIVRSMGKKTDVGIFYDCSCGNTLFAKSVENPCEECGDENDGFFGDEGEELCYECYMYKKYGYYEDNRYEEEQAEIMVDEMILEACENKE